MTMPPKPSMQVPLLDLTPIYAQDREAIDAAIAGVVASQHFIGGPEVTSFEDEVAAFLGGGVHAIGCASGSDAIVLALRALEIGPVDEVICPNLTFSSTATSVSLVGATPVFVDVEASSLNIDVAAALRALSPRTRAVIPVHLFGRPADVRALREGLARHGRTDVAVIEDAAQALGATLDGVPVCRWGDLACTSFFPSKNLGGFGDGGMVFTRDAALAERVRRLRQHGWSSKYCSEILGYNSRLDAIQAAVLRVRLRRLRSWCDMRRENAARIRAQLAPIGDALVLPPTDGEDGRVHHVYNQFTIQLDARDHLLAHLELHGIGSAVYYPRTLAAQPCFDTLPVVRHPTPVADAATRRALSLPIYPGLTDAMLGHVTRSVAAFFDCSP